MTAIRFGFASCAFACVFAAGAALAQTIELKFASTAPPKTPWATQIDRFAADVDRISKGKVKVVPFINGQLGSEQDTINQVQRGRIESGGFSVTAGAQLVPEVALMQAPYLWDSEAQLDCVLDKHLLEPVMKMFDRKGVVFIGWSEVGWTDVVAKKPILTPADAKGIKARVAPARSSAVFWDSLGANGVPLPITEVASALQTGLVEAADLPVTTYVPSGMGKLAPHMTLTRHLHAPGIVLLSKDVYKKLGKEGQKVIEEAATPPTQLRAEVRGLEKAIMAMHKQAGGFVHELTPEQRQMWITQVRPAQEKLVKDTGGDSAKIWKAIQDGKKACASKA